MTDARPEPETRPLRQHLPNLVTILGLGAGLTALRFVYSEGFEVAAALIVLAALIDGLDGLLARRLNVASDFGAELDSLSDFLCFGVAPAFLVYRFALTDLVGLGWVVALLYAIFCSLRLARFNVSRGLPAVERAHFVGVPAPAGALLALLPVFLTFAGLADATAHPLAVAAWLAAIGGLMVSRLQTLSPKALRVSRRWTGWILAGLAVLAAAILFRFWLLMVAVDAVYLGILGYAVATARRGGRA
jgi:CDP-diacylglycerol---serine O-phosphatidyltransferase